MPATSTTCYDPDGNTCDEAPSVDATTLGSTTNSSTAGTVPLRTGGVDSGHRHRCDHHDHHHGGRHGAGHRHVRRLITGCEPHRHDGRSYSGRP